MAVQASQEGHRRTVPRLDHDSDESVDVRHLPGTATNAGATFLRGKVFPREIRTKFPSTKKVEMRTHVCCKCLMQMVEGNEVKRPTNGQMQQQW